MTMDQAALAALAVPGEKPRRRVRMAMGWKRRIAGQRAKLATDYGAATTAQARFNAAASGLRAAASERNQRDNPATAQRLNALTTQILALVDQLHEQQEHRADRVLRAEERRIARKERSADDERAEHAA